MGKNRKVKVKIEPSHTLEHWTMELVVIISWKRAFAIRLKLRDSQILLRLVQIGSMNKKTNIGLGLKASMAGL